MAATEGKVGDWINNLGSTELPALCESVDRISRAASKEDTSAAELATVILEDPSITTKVLKVANSVLYNASKSPINTISRAVIVLGFNQVKNICLSVALIEKLIKGKPSKRLMSEIAQSFHAATQAAELARTNGDKAPEEVYVTTLLYHVGNLAFWCFGGQAAVELDKKLSEGKGSPEQIEREVIGFALKDLTLGLADEWQLGSNLSDALNPNSATSSRWKACTMAHRFTEAVHEGWTSPKVNSIINEMAEYTNREPDQLRNLVSDTAKQAADKLRVYSRSSVMARLIPQAPQSGQTSDNSGAELDPLEDEFELDDTTLAEPNPTLQLNILQEMLSVVYSKPDINLIMHMTCEGLNRGAGLDRVVVAILTRDRSALRTLYVVGKDASLLKEQFICPLGHCAGLFDYILKQQNLAWFAPDREGDEQKLVDKRVVELVGTDTFLMAPILVGQKEIGLFYADNLPSGDDISIEDYASFQHFTRQANLCLQIIKQRQSKS